MSKLASASWYRRLQMTGWRATVLEMWRSLSMVTRMKSTSYQGNLLYMMLGLIISTRMIASCLAHSPPGPPASHSRWITRPPASCWPRPSPPSRGPGLGSWPDKICMKCHSGAWRLDGLPVFVFILTIIQRLMSWSSHKLANIIF